MASVDKVLDVLEAFGQEELGVTELAKRLGILKNNAFRLLSTLLLRGYIEQNPKTEAYRRGPKCIDLAQTTLDDGLEHALSIVENAVKQARQLLPEGR